MTTTPREHGTVLRMQESTVRFGSVVANDRVSFDLRRGEIHALLGENGAGKTTLMRVLAGFIQPDAGELFVEDRPTRFESVADSAAAGIGMVHQHFMLVGTMTVAENVSLGLRSAGRVFPRVTRVAAELRDLSTAHGLAVDPTARISSLSIGQQQRVEILKVLHRGATILILDEPTAVLTPGETDSLLALLRDLASQGTSIVFISHKLREIRAIADRVTVLRQGRSLGTVDMADATDTELTSRMIGRESAPPTESTAPLETADSTPRLQVSGIRYTDRRGVVGLDDIALRVAPGEILGIAGVDGNGQTELAEVLSGIRRPASGRLEIDGVDVTALPVSGRLSRGLAHVPEDRQTTGLILDLSIAENLALDSIGKAPFSRRGALNRDAVRTTALSVIERFDIRCSGPDQPVRELSGGNQQKVLIARAVLRSPRVLVVAQPTRGVDLGAVENIHRQIRQLAEDGCAVVLISTELDEVLALSHRIAVLYSGRIIATHDRADVDPAVLGLNMAGTPA